MDELSPLLHTTIHELGGGAGNAVDEGFLAETIFDCARGIREVHGAPSDHNSKRIFWNFRKLNFIEKLWKFKIE